MKQTLYFSFILFLFLSCQSNPSDSNFKGDSDALQLAEEMFEAIGGKMRWANLRSVYIQAIHEEPELKYPYKSEIWRDLDDFKVRIEQQSPEFHKVGYFSDAGCYVLNLNLDSIRQISTENVRNGHNHNVYVLLHRYASEEGFKVISPKENRIDFYEGDSLFLCGFELDSLKRPHHFITKNNAGEEQVFIFSKWGTTEGLVHSAGGGPVDGDFSYDTKIWQPSEQNYEASFDFPYQLKSFEMQDLDWVMGKWQRINKEGINYEAWEKANDSTFVGKNYKIEGSDSTFLESIRIEYRNGNAFYIPMVENQNDGQAIPFQLTAAFENRFIFSNPDHDFPKKIVYIQAAPDTLKARVVGENYEDGNWMEMVFWK